MKNRYLRTSPNLFRKIKRSLLACVFLLLALAPFIEAPLQEPANLARVPNPVKSAWFLLWIQELVSYGSVLINLVLLLGAFFLVLPWVAGNKEATEAKWLARDQRTINSLSLLVVCVIVGLTVVAMFFRGENWLLTVPIFR